MEDIDDETPIPDKNGILDMSNHTWASLDDVVWTHAKLLIVLNVSNNFLTSISSDLGKLVLMRELDISGNKIKIIPSSIGKCTLLRKLNFHNNLIEEIPSDIQWCTMLEEVYAGNNVLTTLPDEFKKLQELRILDVRNNQLTKIPASLCECTKLGELGCDGNSGLTDIPEELREHTKLVLWICKKTQDHKKEIEQLAEINNNLEDMARLADEEKLRLKDEILRLEALKKSLEDERPERYLRLKKKIKTTISRVCIIM